MLMLSPLRAGYDPETGKAYYAVTDPFEETVGADQYGDRRALVELF